jgi:hypothetical protein
MGAADCCERFNGGRVEGGGGFDVIGDIGWGDEIEQDAFGGRAEVEGEVAGRIAGIGSGMELVAVGGAVEIGVEQGIGCGKGVEGEPRLIWARDARSMAWRINRYSWSSSGRTGAGLAEASTALSQNSTTVPSGWGGITAPKRWSRAEGCSSRSRMVTEMGWVGSGTRG